MTEAEKFVECLRICGPHVTEVTHRIAPEMCPIQLDYWRGNLKKPQGKLFPPIEGEKAA